MKKLVRYYISIVLCLFAVVFASTFKGYSLGDNILNELKLKAWSSSNGGFHYTIIYSFIILVIAFFIGIEKPLLFIKKVVSNKLIMALLILIVGICVINILF